MMMRKPRAIRANPEDQIHRAIVAKLRGAGVAFFHLYNPGTMTPHARAKAKALGATSPKGSPLLGGTGVPDLMIITPPPCGGYVGAALELKAPHGRARPEQREWLARLASIGWATAVVYGEAEALERLRLWGYAVRSALCKDVGCILVDGLG